MDTLRYPIGKYTAPTEVSAHQRAAWMADIKRLPAMFRQLSESLTEAELETPYRPDGWTARQVIHHVADSHMNAYIRFRWTLTEDAPTIKAYEEALWAVLPDAKNANIAPSLGILDGVHARWSLLMEAMTESDWKRTFFHPQSQKLWSLETVLGLYAWHGAHHLAHIRLVEQGMTRL